MSITSCCAPKNWGMLHDEAGHAADGGPQLEMSMESVALVTDAGTLARCRGVSARQHEASGFMEVTYIPEPNASSWSAVSERRRYELRETYKIPVVSNCVAQTPPPLSANAWP